MTDLIRHNFSAPTKRLLAERAGYCCSAPNCGKVTIGPNFDADSSAGDGTAAHIVSASPDSGPRANKNYTKEQRESPDNGIWLCRTHATLIDSDENRYSVELLKMWKRDHEDEMVLEMGGSLVGNGVVTRVVIENVGRFTAKQAISFGAKTFLLGGNFTGKQLISDCIGSLADYEKLKKWQHGRPGKARGIVTIEAFNKTKNTWEIAFDERLKCSADEVAVPKIFSGFKVIELNRGFEVIEMELSRDSYPGLTDEEWEETASKLHRRETIDALAKHVGFSTEELLTMLQLMSQHPQRYFADVQVHGDEVRWKVGNDTQYFAFEQLGGGRSQLVLVDLFVRVAEFCARFAPTILILNQHGFPSLDVNNLNLVIDQLRQAPLQCQLVMPLFIWQAVRDFEGWRTWHLVEVAGENGPVEVRAYDRVSDAK